MDKTRQIIRKHATELGARYRITKDGHVDYHGTMPHANQIGWYFVSWNADDLARMIESGEI